MPSNLPSPSSDNLLARRRVLGPAYRLFYDVPVHPVRGEDVWMWDADGKRYLDAYNNVPVVGHANPTVVQALASQAAVLNTHTRYLHDGVVTYAERLVALFPAALDTAMFTCTGSEANDLALRIATQATGRTGLIVTSNAYHGVTLSLADMSPSLRPVAGHVRTVAPPDSYRGDPAQVAAQFAAAIDAAAEDLKHAGTPVAALMVDTVFASDGIFTDANQALKMAADTIHRHGGLFIADEVQGGFARAGETWWAFERDAFVPDMVSMGKPMGNGHPIGALVLQSDLIEEFGKNCRYFNTFGGNAVSAAVGLAVLDVLQGMDAPRHVADVGAYLGDGLHKLAERTPFIGDVRGRGLYWGVELVDAKRSTEPAAQIATALVNGLRHHGVLIGASGPRANVLKIRPPLTFQKAHADLLLQTLAQQCETLAATLD